LRWSEFPITFSRKDHWVHIPDPGTYLLVVNPIVDGAFLPKTLINGGSNLNIIFTETLHKMDIDFNKMTACDEPFYGVVRGKAAYLRTMCGSRTGGWSLPCVMSDLQRCVD
jgi:hypothetical protein